MSVFEFQNVITPPPREDIKHYVPTLFIGLGGTGKDVLMLLRKRLFDDSPAPRKYLRYLMLDTNVEQWWPSFRTQEEFTPVRPLGTEAISCQINDTDFYDVFNLLEDQNDPRFVGWLKPTLRELGADAVNQGAGTHRQFGRLAFMLKFPDIRRSIEEHLEKMLEEVGGLKAEERKGAEVEKETIEVVIITSLAGGTGSGMFLDTAYLVQDIIMSNPILRTLKKKYVTLIAVMPTAYKDVVDPEMYKKFQQNGYAALLELEHYGTAQTGDDVFLGALPEGRAGRNRTGFVAPWKQNEFIEGRGWQVCYLIDNLNPLRKQTPLSKQETYEMIADYLFLDFQNSQFATQKRSARCNLAQWKQDMIRFFVRNPEIASKQGSRLARDQDVVYIGKAGCSFSSFGLSQISFSRQRVYRAAAYLLAYRLVVERWLGSADYLQKAAYKDVVREDLFSHAAGLSFDTDEILQYLYRADKGANWHKSAMDDCSAAEDIPFTEGTARLRSLLQKHQGLLQRGPASLAVQDNAATLKDVSRVLPPLHQRLKDAVRRRADAHGVAVARELLNYYRATARKTAESFARQAEPSRENIRRLEEADTVRFPARTLSQRIEFPHACQTTCDMIRFLYRAAAAPAVTSTMDRIVEFIGEENVKKPPELETHGTLYEYFAEADRLLKAIATRLQKRFSDFSREKGTDRSQLLSPEEWTEKEYNEQINGQLERRLGRSARGSGFDWDKFEEHFFERLHEEGDDRRRKVDRTVTSVIGLLDRWIERRATGERAVTEIAELLASACLSLLSAIELNLRDYYDGCVADLLENRCKSDVRADMLEKLVRSGSPYLTMDVAGAAQKNGGYKPKFSDMVGLQQGDIPDTSAANKAELLRELDDLTQTLSAVIAGSPLETDQTSLVLCREVWGVPLQYYSFLEQLWDAYTQSDHIDECHINTYECWEDLPEVRGIKSNVYRSIGSNVETALFSMMIGTITCNKERVYVVRVPDRVTGVGWNTFRLGKRISRIIKKVCEEQEISEFLNANQAKWEDEATPQKWAILYASALWTYEYTRFETIGGVTDEQLSPLRNCTGALLKRFERQLQASDEGRQWLQQFDFSAPTHAESRSRLKSRFEDLIDRKRILVQPSDYVPIWEVDWTRLDQFQLPTAATGNVPTADR